MLFRHLHEAGGGGPGEHAPGLARDQPREQAGRLRRADPAGEELARFAGREHGECHAHRFGLELLEPDGVARDHLVLDGGERLLRQMQGEHFGGGDAKLDRVRFERGDEGGFRFLACPGFVEQAHSGEPRGEVVAREQLLAGLQPGGRLDSAQKAQENVDERGPCGREPREQPLLLAARCPAR
jgi:hypothetical protein